MKTQSAPSNQSGIKFNKTPCDISCRTSVEVDHRTASVREIANLEALSEAVSLATLGNLPRIRTNTKGTLVQVDNFKAPQIIAEGHVERGLFIPKPDQKIRQQLAPKDLLLFIPQEVLAMQIDLHTREIAVPVNLRKITPTRIGDLIDIASSSSKSNAAPIRALQALQEKAKNPSKLVDVFSAGTDLVLLDFSTGKAIPVAPAKVRNLALSSFEAALHAADINPKYQAFFDSRNRTHSLWMPRELLEKKIA
jgi:hypothetical protein